MKSETDIFTEQEISLIGRYAKAYIRHLGKVIYERELENKTASVKVPIDDLEKQLSEAWVIFNKAVKFVKEAA